MIGFLKYVWAEEGWSGKIGICLVLPVALGCILTLLGYLVDAASTKVTIVHGVVEQRVYRPQEAAVKESKWTVVEAYMVIVKLDSGPVISCRTEPILWAGCTPGQKVEITIYRGALGMNVRYYVTFVEE